MRTFPRHELLDAEQEIDLARRIEAGVLARAVLDGEQPTEPSPGCPGGATTEELTVLVEIGTAAQQRFLMANLRLIGLVAARSVRVDTAAEDDLFQDGFCALITAVRRFDHRRGVRFATYALPWIRAALTATVAAAQPGGCSPYELRRRRALDRADADLTSRLGRSPTIAELACDLDRSPRWVREHRSGGRTVSLDALAVDVAVAWPATTEAGGAGGATAPDGGADESAESVAALAALDGLAEPWRSVLRWRFGFDGPPAGHREIADRLGVSRSTATRLEHRALELLRHRHGSLDGSEPRVGAVA